MERILGPDLGAFVRPLHEEHGVVFHLENTATAWEGARLVLGGAELEVDFIVAGLGVRPRIGLAETAGLKTAALRWTPGLKPALRRNWPVCGSGQRAMSPAAKTTRVEHWVVAERQGQVTALNMLGLDRPFDAVPFFWGQHSDVPINYVGHAERWDDIAVDGATDCLLRFRLNGPTFAVASIFRDIQSLEAEVGMEGGAPSP